MGTGTSSGMSAAREATRESTTEYKGYTIGRVAGSQYESDIDKPFYVQQPGPYQVTSFYNSMREARNAVDFFVEYDRRHNS